MSGENYSPPSEFKTREGFTWIDATHLVGHVAGGTDGDGWVWEPGTAPKLVDPYPYLAEGTDLWVSGKEAVPRHVRRRPSWTGPENTGITSGRG